MAGLQNVDELFPAQPQGVDELFPADVERERYRRQTLGTSPIQDMIFGDTSVNPVARVLDHFGQGAKQGWGAEPGGLSQESTDAMKKAGIFNDYDKGQRSIIKAMNESLFRGAATLVVDPIMRGLPAAFRGVQEAIAQTGEEVGQPKLGREAAGALEAFPAGFRQPTGVPHAPPHPMLAEIERARDMGVIGAGEAGWKGTAEVPAPTIKEQAAAVKPEVLESGKPVEGEPARPLAEPVPADVAPAAVAETPIAGAAEAVGAPITAEHPIAQDVARKLTFAGRPAEEASASGQVIASHYEARAARFGGELGTAEELYKAEGAAIRGPNGEAPAPVVPPRPKIVMPGEGATPERANQSLLDFLAREGGLKPTEDLKQMFGGENPTIPGAGRLFRKDGMSMDEALTKAKENSFILDPNDIQHAPGAANRGELTKSVNDLQDMISEEAGGNKQYRNTRSAEPAKINKDEEYKHIADKLADEIEASGGSAADIDPVTERRVVEMIQKGEAPDVLSAYERAVMEDEYNQIKRGKIRFSEDGKAVITLFKDANSSTFIHETGHHWLEELMKDSQHEKAPASIRADADSVLKWLGVDTPFDIKVRHHEQFARGFERYMMEGKAPTQGLARVFEAFKNWLTKIYQTVDRLKSPINDEIRGVFDRLVALKPEQVKIEPEGAKSFADIHEADALSATPETAHPVAETIRAERDRLAADQIPEEHDARLEGVASKAERREAGGPQPVRDGNEAARPQEAGNDQASGAVGEGGSVAPAEGARPSAQSRTEVPVSSQEPFKTESPLVDKAGNIRLDNLSTPEDVSQVIRDAAVANNDFIDARRGVVTDGQVLELADALGMDEGQLNRRKLGEAFNAEQIMAARKLLIQSATTVRDAMVKAATGSEAEIMAYAEAKQRHRMIQEQVSGLTAEAGRALRAFRKLEGQQEAKQLDAFLKDATGKTLFQLQREAQLGMQLDTPAQVSKFVNDTSKPSLKDMVIEAWMSALLSGPKTHLANVMGNTISGLWRPLETLTASGIGKARSLVTGSKDRVLPGEAAAELFGMVQGSREGVVAAYKAFKTGEGQLTTTRQAEQYNPRALPSATVNLFGKDRQIGGEQARIPLRMLTAEDEFFKSVAYRGDINRQAYAIAAQEGLPAEQTHVRIAELSANPTEEMIANAKRVAEYQTFQTPLGNVGRSVQNFSNSHILAKLVVPFVRTPINLLKYAGERSPLGVFSREVRDNLAGKNGAVARDTQIARITLGTMVGVAALEMASQGLITGGGPADPKQKAIMRANGWQDYSVKIGDMYYRYNRLDPFSIILGTVADAYEINQASGAKDTEKQHLMALIFGAVSKNILERASLKGPSDLIQAVTDPERYGKSYIKSLSGTIVPSISAQTAQAMDPIIRDARTVVDGLKARIPGLSQTLMPKRDIWGEPMVREGGLGPDLLSPIVESRLKNDPVNKALLSAGYYPGKMDRKIRGVELTDQQYDDYQRIAGRTAKVRLNAIVSMPGFEQMPESTRKELMTNTIQQSREMARSLIMMQNPEIMKKANDAKRANLH
ncbi:hypothetical protein IVB27_32470 [Bradyrhizobium sp. 197]|uniref:hypothetical protein n=1 Tax=Bradyrhizobium sp. 197 TaxID=2782663 RepID=UPI001FF76CEC|nr:hypothetical protein [Bradyrhizobium sp. 197]MCK1479330.1 hypothetical protein [Bradyrhizobium sp. 197]